MREYRTPGSARGTSGNRRSYLDSRSVRPCERDDRADARVLALERDRAAERRREQRHAVEVERSFLAELGGDCDLPAGAHAELIDGSPLMPN